MGTEPATDAELYARHAAELVRFATVLHGPSDADDLVANAVVRAFTSAGWPLVENRRAYLFRAVLNEARLTARAASRRRRREQNEVGVGWDDPPTVRPEVIAAVRRLDHRQRAVVFFTYWQDLDPPSIAAELGINVRTVQRELAAARQKLAKELR